MLDDSEPDGDENRLMADWEIESIVQKARRNLEAANKSLKESAEKRGVTFVSGPEDD